MNIDFRLDMREGTIKTVSGVRYGNIMDVIIPCPEVGHIVHNTSIGAPESFVSELLSVGFRIDSLFTKKGLVSLMPLVYPVYETLLVCCGEEKNEFS